MQPQNLNLDAYRLERASARRKDDEIIDQVCIALLQSQARVQELEAQVGAYKSAPSIPKPTNPFPPIQESPLDFAAPPAFIS